MSHHPQFEQREGRGGPFVVWLPEGENEVVLGSRFDPHDHALKTLKPLKTHPQQALVIVSPGLTHLGQTAKTLGFAKIIQVEMNPELRDIYMEVQQKSDPEFWYRPDPQELQDWLMANMAPGAPIPAVVWAHPHLKKHQDYVGMVEVLEQGLQKAEGQSKTIQKVGGLFLQNILDNLPLLKRAGGLRELAGCMEGRTLILAGAGPSLRELKPLMEERPDIPILAVDMAWFPLKAMGRTPDLVVSMDPFCINLMKIHPDRNLSVPLVAGLSSCPGVLRRFSGPTYLTVSYSPFAEALGVGDEPQLRGQGAVGSHLFNLGLLMGAENLILAGLDFAKLGDDFYAPGQFWDSSTSGKPQDKSYSIKVQGMRGDTLLTHPAYSAALESIDAMISELPPNSVRIFNLGQGAKIKSAQPGVVGELIEEIPMQASFYLPAPLPIPSLWAKRLEPVRDRFTLLAKLMEEGQPEDETLAKRLDKERLLHEGLGQVTAQSAGMGRLTYDLMLEYVRQQAWHLNDTLEELKRL